ncbi:hypothetical protein [uncultured Prevotella sp.]|jgi:hypothetical protein|uniref:hypothetical protein n=1 Tax=uncultured Prevotella sp. TaxID=159272 RepID=UPI0025DABB46|nr:hypothetical protein [uncultured Prevotella sp.]
MKEMRLLLVFLLVLATGGAVAQESNVTVGDVSNTDCAMRTRSEGNIGNPRLKLTRFEGGLYGELINCEVNCAYGDVKVICQENDSNLNIGVDAGTGDILAACVCQINIYFTIFNALKDEYQVTVRGKNIGKVSFKEHSVVEIDLVTLAQAYEEGFDYPVKVEGLSTYEFTKNIQPGENLNKVLEFLRGEGQNSLFCSYQNYVLPCEYSYLDVQAELDKDSTLLINVMTDGIPGQGCLRVATLFFNLVNVFRESYHLKFYHTIVSADEERQVRCSVCLYDGVLNVPDANNTVSIPIVDDNDYNSLVVAGVGSSQTVGAATDPSIVDLQGRRLNAEPKHGVYIKNGKKVVK